MVSGSVGCQIRYFAKRAGEVSGGAITVKPVWLAAGDVAHFETATAQQAIDGDLDLALVASRAWDTVGVNSLTPLNAPFLVNTDELVSEVVSGPVQDELLSGLPQVGVVGLGMWPEGLRHPFGFGQPLNAPADYARSTIRAPYSKTTQDMFAALGAETTDGPVDPSKQRGAESSYRLVPAGTATGNVVFYPKVNVLVANAEVEAGLTDRQRDALARATEDTRTWVLENLPSDNEAARTFCAEGGHIQSASPAQVEAMVRATKPVVDAMRKDQVVAGVIGEIEAMAAGIKAEKPLSDCGDKTDAEALAQLNGDYAFTVTAAAGRKAGVTDPEVLNGGSGRYTAHLKDGTWTLDHTYTEGPSKGTSDSGLGDYTVEGDQFTWYWSHEPGQHVTATFKVLPDGSLEFGDVVSAEGGDWARLATVHFSHWKRIGG